MKRHLLILPLAMLPLAAMAQDLPQIEDADGNGIWSMTEMQTVWPDLTQDTFTAADVNADGGLDVAELTKAMADGMIAAPAN